MLQGRASRSGYALLLRNLLPVYDALETGLERHRGRLAALAEPRLYRADAIRLDLLALGGDPELLPEGRAYAVRVAAAGPGRLIAHAYVRYLGDLNGGRALRRILARAPGLTPAELHFHDFPGISNLERFARAYRAAVDRAAGEAGDGPDVLAEAAAAFEDTIRLADAVRAVG